MQLQSRMRNKVLLMELAKVFFFFFFVFFFFTCANEEDVVVFAFGRFDLRIDFDLGEPVAKQPKGNGEKSKELS